MLRHLADSPDGHRLVNDLGPEGADALFSVRYADADAATLRANLFERYSVNGLDATERATFARLTADPELQHSWVRAAGAEKTDLQGVKRATDHYNSVHSNGHSTTEFKTSAEANSHPYHQGSQDPHRDGGIVVEYEIQSQDSFYRVYDSSGEHIGGRWMMDEQALSDLSTPKEVFDRFGLSKAWQDYDRVGMVRVGTEAEGARMQISTASRIDDVEAGVTIVEDINSKIFT